MLLGHLNYKNGVVKFLMGLFEVEQYFEKITKQNKMFDVIMCHCVNKM